MGETYAGPAVSSCRDQVTGLMEAGEPFVHVEDVIDERADLTLEAKAALWLLAFSMRAPHDQLRDARAHVAALERVGVH
jgi:hypothetical protein